MATHSSILAWRNPWTEDPGRLQPMGSQRVGHDWIDLAHKPPRPPRQTAEFLRATSTCSAALCMWWGDDGSKVEQLAQQFHRSSCK